MSTNNYEREDVERILAVLFNGGTPWRSEESPDRDMPKADTNPSRSNTFAAEKIDIDRAWWSTFDYLRNPEAVYWHLGWGMTQRDIAEHQGRSPRSVSNGIARDIGLLRDAANAGAKPRGKQLRRYLEVRKVA